MLPDLETVVFTEFDGYLFGEGKHYDCCGKLGAHPCQKEGIEGVYFALWAPHAQQVSVLTDCNGYQDAQGLMHPAQGNVGVWELFLPKAKAGDIYRYAIVGCDGVRRLKTDPCGFFAQRRPENASVVADTSPYPWKDEAYLSKRKPSPAKPMSIYEVHLGSWKKDYRLGEDGFLNYRDYAPQLAEYARYMGYTHVELMGICEHPFDGSWGYQCTGFFAPTSRYGTPEDFRFLVDTLHAADIGVILDWVPAHFPKDAFAMGELDGTHLYEYADPLRMEMPGWGTYAFDHGKNQVRSFLISSALYWIREFHMDGLRVDAVASLLQNNFDRAEYRPNRYGGVENIEGMDFLRLLTDAVHQESTAIIIAEDSSIVPGITAPTKEGGFGFDYKWNLGWMNDTLKYFEKDPIYRKYHHGALTHTYDYAFTEQFVLVLSHDEVVHLKKSMWDKMPGRVEDKYAALKTLYTLQFTSPGKKLLFMGQELAQPQEWDEKRELGWWMAEDFSHRDVMQCVKNLNSLYRTYPCLYTDSRDERTLAWVNRFDADRGLLAYIRKNPWNYEGALLVIANLTPVERRDYTCGIPTPDYCHRVFSTYDSLPGQGNPAEVGELPPLIPAKGECDGYPYRLTYSLRPYETAVIALK